MAPSFPQDMDDQVGGEIHTLLHNRHSPKVTPESSNLELQQWIEYEGFKPHVAFLTSMPVSELLGAPLHAAAASVPSAVQHPGARALQPYLCSPHAPCYSLYNALLQICRASMRT